MAYKDIHLYFYWTEGFSMRNSRNLLGFLMVAVLLMAPVMTAFAAVVDCEVEAAIDNGESEIPVIITLKSSQSFQNLLAQDLTREARIETLQARSAQSFESFAVTANFTSRNYRQFWIFNGFAVTASAAEVDAFASNPGVERIEYDSTEFLNPEVAIDGTPRGDWTYGLENLGIPAIRSQFGLDGSGVVVGVIDTGVDGNHPDLQGKVIGFKDFVNGKTEPYDDQGHGSHCCGTIAGGNASGTQIGVAPNAKLIVAKVFSASGSTQTSYLLGAMEFMTDPDGNPSTDDAPSIVSNSWGGSGTATTYLEVTKQWVALGIFPSFAAGNSGPGSRTMGTPGAYLEAFAVGATQANDSIASFSSRGPVEWDGVDHIKPDVSAPGYDVFSVKPGGGYTKMSGTSMACPHVSGVIALIHQASPGISINDVRELLEGTSKDLGTEGKDNTFGAGRVNALAAVEIAISGGRVSGNLTDSANNPLQGTVHIVENNIDIKVSLSGKFMTTLPEGTYNLIGRAYGFVDSAPVEVSVVASGDHTVALKLERAPAGTVAGKVVAADGGVMINATVRVLDTPVAPVVCNGGNFKVTLPAGSYKLQVTAFGYATTLVEGVSVVASQSSNIVVKMAGLPEVLLVDDDGGKSYESYYKKSLDALGISYDVINVKEAGQLKADEVIAYASVIWFTGDDYQGTLTAADQAIVDEYLKKGGSLILSGQDIAYDIKRSDLLNKVLMVTFKDDSSNQKMVKGLDLYFSIFGGALNQKYAERYEVITPGSVLFNYDDGTCAAVYANTYAGKSATCGFGFEGIADGERDMVIEAVLNKVASTDLELINRIRFFETDEQMVRYAEIHAHRLSNLTSEELFSLQNDLTDCRPLAAMINAELSNR
jgi:subtilisin family serine protease